MTSAAKPSQDLRKALPQHRAAGRRGAADPSSRRNFFSKFERCYFRQDGAPLPPRPPAARTPAGRARRPQAALTIFGQALDHLHGRLEPGGVHGAGLRHLRLASRPVPRRLPLCHRAGLRRRSGSRSASPAVPPAAREGAKRRRAATAPPPHRPPAAAGARVRAAPLPSAPPAARCNARRAAPRPGLALQSERDPQRP